MDCSDQTFSPFCILKHLNWDGDLVTDICVNDDRDLNISHVGLEEISVGSVFDRRSQFCPQSAAA